MCVCACVRACVCACVHVCVHVCMCVYTSGIGSGMFTDTVTSPPPVVSLSIPRTPSLYLLLG